MRKLAVFSLATIAAIGTFAALADDLPAVDPAIATMTVDQKVEARQAAMSDDGRLLRGARNATGDAAVQAATTVLHNMVNFPALFADGATNTKSHALPIVWEQFDDFASIFKDGQLAATKMLEAARAGDAAAYAEAFAAVNQTCFECHQTYRGR